MKSNSSVMDVNVVGVQRVTRAMLPAMRKAGKGLIFNISASWVG